MGLRFLTSGTNGGTVRKDTAITPQAQGTTSETPDTSTTAIPVDSNRVDFTLSNKHDTAIIWLSKGGTADVGYGLPVYPGETYEDDSFTGNVNVASSVASVPYSYTQT